jgi:GH25 family lysozyme M1 (1,4-beta-N-acetylmuramidase)
MTIAFPDLSNWEPNLNLEPATVAVIAKATEGTYYQDKSYSRFKSEAAAQGSVFSGYHFLKSEISAEAQADYYHAFAGATPCMLDVETEGASSPTVDEVVAFANRLRAVGGRAWASYFPNWYWERVGGDLSRLTAAGLVLVSSSYTSYSDTGPGWAPYGGATPRIWQYTNAKQYGGAPCDFNAFKGTVAELAVLINGAPVPVPPPRPTPAPSVSLHIVQMCAHEDPARPQGQTTNAMQVLPVQGALEAEGLLSASDKRWGRGSFGSMTVAAYAAWQRRLGYNGSAADGIPGQDSLSKLGAKHGFHVVA